MQLLADQGKSDRNDILVDVLDLINTIVDQWVIGSYHLVATEAFKNWQSRPTSDDVAQK